MLALLIVCVHAWGEADVVKGHNDLEAVNQTCVNSRAGWQLWRGLCLTCTSIQTVDTLTFICANECRTLSGTVCTCLLYLCLWIYEKLLDIRKWGQFCRVRLFQFFFTCTRFWFSIGNLILQLKWEIRLLVKDFSLDLIFGSDFNLQ